MKTFAAHVSAVDGEAVAAPVRSRGVLRLPPEYAGLRISRHSPCSALASCIAYYWRVSWDLRGRPPHLQETLPHPNVYLVFEEDRLQLSGVSTRKFKRMLIGQGFAFGVKFKPGGLHPFMNAPVSSLTDRIVPAVTLFGTPADELQARLASCGGAEQMAEAVQNFLLHQAPQADPDVAFADGLVNRILHHPEIRTVDDLAGQTGLGKRTLQRIFREYVGVPPKWVIRRYRLHELIERLEAGDHFSWSDLAVELGYFDQAHLIRDFRTMTGYSPGKYQQRSPAASI